MRKLTTIIIMVMIFAMSSVGVFADSGLTYRTAKANKGYVTKFYNDGHYVGKVKTAKRLVVKIVRDKNATEKVVNRRCGKYILVEKVNGKCINKRGDGRTTKGHYIKYKNAHKGDKFTSYLVYEDSKYIDDISIRVDVKR